MAITGKRAPKDKAAKMDAVTAAAVESIKDEIAAGNVNPADLPADTAALLAPEGTALPETVVDQPAQPENVAAENQAPIVVFTKEQLAAQKLMNRDIFLTWYSERPQTARWVEPSEEQIDERIGKLMGERAIKPTNFFAIGKLAEEVAAMIAAERAASGIDAAIASDIAYLRAAQHALNDLSGYISTMLGELGVKVTTSTRKSSSSGESKPRAASSSAKASWKEKNTKLIAYAKSLGLPACVLIDTASGGYDGEDGKHLHCVKAHDNGQWEECDVNGTGKGIFHDTPIYFKAKDGARPKYSPAQMFNVHMFGKRVEGLNIVVKGEHRDAADLSVFSAAAGI